MSWRQRPRSLTSITAALSASALAAAGITTATATPTNHTAFEASNPASHVPNHDVTSPQDAAWVDSVQTPSQLNWASCDEGLECATLDVPMDYSNPAGAKYQMKLTRLPATSDPDNKKSIFVNPGGPGLHASYALTKLKGIAKAKEIRKTFNIVGIDPRATGGKPKAKCFTDAEEQGVINGLLLGSPQNSSQKGTFKSASVKLSDSCADTEIAHHASTAQLARDLEVARRAINGDHQSSDDNKMTFVGFSFGTMLGQTYANIFPDRVRAIYLDATINAEDWTGTNHGNKDENLLLRMGAPEAAEASLKELLKQCQEAADKTNKPQDPTKSNDPNDPQFPLTCALAEQPVGQFNDATNREPTVNDATPHAEKVFASLHKKLKKTPVFLDASVFHPIEPDATGSRFINHNTLTLLSDQAMRRDITAVHWAETLANINHEVSKQAVQAQPGAAHSAEPTPSQEEPEYSSQMDAMRIITCANGQHPTLDSNIDQMMNSSKRHPYFGELLTVMSAPCGSDTWKAVDKNAYLGPFDKRTTGEFLIVSSNWDTITSSSQADRISRRIGIHGNLSRVNSNGWGHGSFLFSECVQDAAIGFIVDLNTKDTGDCLSEPQPFDVKFIEEVFAQNGGGSNHPWLDRQLPAAPQ